MALSVVRTLALLTEHSNETAPPMAKTSISCQIRSTMNLNAPEACHAWVSATKHSWKSARPSTPRVQVYDLQSSRRPPRHQWKAP